MRQSVIVLALGGMFWAASPPGLWSGSANPKQDIESASAVFLSERHMSRTAAQKALADLLASASQLSRDTDLPEAAEERLAVAAAAYAKGGFLEREAVAKVHRAYEAVNQGRAFVFPDSVASVREAKEHGRRQIQDALDALSAGRSKEAVLEVLGFVLLVTTPMEQDR